MYKLLFTMTLVLSFCTFSYAQGEYEKCYFGTAGLDFGSWFPSVLTNSQMIAHESAVSMCAKNGDLLFYSNGGNSPTAPSIVGAVWNANHQIMENGILGDSSGCISSLEGAVAFPAEINNSKALSNSTYYIFMRDCVESSVAEPYFNSGLTYCEIDMDANGGLGKVVSKNNSVVPFMTNSGLSTDREPLAAILNGEDDGWYVFSYQNDSLYSVEVNANGIGGFKYHVEGNSAIVFSPSREHVAIGNKLYNYNAIKNELTFNMSLSETTYAFSPNGKVLYGLGSSKLQQYDLTASSIVDSKITISTSALASKIYLAPDGRIYLFTINSGSIPGYIDCPNYLGLSCGLSMSSIYLDGRQAGDVFTSIPANFLYHDDRGCHSSVPSYENGTALFEVYPNPTNGQLTILVNELKEPIPFQVVSLDGKIVHSGVIVAEKQIVNLSTVQTGVYFVDVMGVKKRLVLR